MALANWNMTDPYRVKAASSIGAATPLGSWGQQPGQIGIPEGPIENPGFGQFTQSPQNPWGTSGNPMEAYEAEKQRINALNRTVGENQSYDDPTDPRNVMINGQSMFRLGDGSGLPVSADYLKQLQSGATYDPVHGFVVDPNLAAQAQKGSYTGEGTRGPLTGFNSKLNSFSTFGLSKKLEEKYPALRNTDPLGDMAGKGYGFLIPAAVLGGGIASGAFGAGGGEAAAGGLAGGVPESYWSTLADAGVASDAAPAAAGTIAETGVGELAAEAAPLAGPPSAAPAPSTPGSGGYTIDPNTGDIALNSAKAGSGNATALSKLLNGTASTQDWISLLGTLGATGLGMFSSKQKADTIEGELARQRAERAPFLNASQKYLEDPQAYTEGPGQAAMKGTLAGLSAKFGNPIGAPAALALANQAALLDWRNAVTGFGNLGLGGQDTRANLSLQGANATGDIYSNLAGGISDIINPRKTLADYLREYKIGVT